ncbi:MAG: peptidoglycan-binding domain-containing protein, partial [Aeromonas sp.]
DEGRVAELLASPLPDWDAAMWQQQLARYGYGLPRSGQWDEQSRAAMRAFQLHFRTSKVDSEPDSECQAILMALLEKYFP